MDSEGGIQRGDWQVGSGDISKEDSEDLVMGTDRCLGGRNEWTAEQAAREE